jgi:hypothetical protein
VLLLVPSVDVPAGLPTPCALLDEPPTFVPVVPCMPTVGELLAEPVGAPAAVLFGEEVLVSGFGVCATAAPESASAKANAKIFMGCPFTNERQPCHFYYVPTLDTVRGHLPGVSARGLGRLALRLGFLGRRILRQRISATTLPRTSDNFND